MWDALAEIARREGRTVHDICLKADRSRRQSTLTAGLRVYILSYFREAATTEGHAIAGHGDPRYWVRVQNSRAALAGRCTPSTRKQTIRVPGRRLRRASARVS
jgi:predicted DNA-binding ribbon-helix-helix protein